MPRIFSTTYSMYIWNECFVPGVSCQWGSSVLPHVWVVCNYQRSYKWKLYRTGSSKSFKRLARRPNWPRVGTRLHPWTRGKDLSLLTLTTVHPIIKIIADMYSWALQVHQLKWKIAVLLLNKVVGSCMNPSNKHRNVHIHTYTCMYIRIYTYTCIRTHVRTYIRIVICIEVLQLHKWTHIWEKIWVSFAIHTINLEILAVI